MQETGKNRNTRKVILRHAETAGPSLISLPIFRNKCVDKRVRSRFLKTAFDCLPVQRKTTTKQKTKASKKKKKQNKGI